MLVRERFLLNHKFYEFLFVYKDGKLVLSPWQTKFNGRVESHKFIAECNGGEDLIIVKSQGFLKEEETSYEKIENSQGIWLVPNDCIEKGEYSPEKVPGIAQFYGIEIDKLDCKRVLHMCNKLFINVSFPISAYHGTEKSNQSAIFKDGLKESFGMLGNAVYLGTFWKACRFACFTHDYFDRSGIVYRVLVFLKSFQEFPFESWKCECDNKCGGTMSDHSSLWKILHDGAHVSSGTEKGDLKNEEWAVKDRVVSLTHVAEIVPYHYNPLKRNIKIK